MLKKASSFVLASLKASTYGKEYASASRSLRPRWAAFLNILSGAQVIGEQSASLWPSRTPLDFAMASGQAFLAPRFEVCWKMHLGQV